MEGLFAIGSIGALVYSLIPNKKRKDITKRTKNHYTNNILQDDSKKDKISKTQKDNKKNTPTQSFKNNDHPHPSAHPNFHGLNNSTNTVEDIENFYGTMNQNNDGTYQSQLAGDSFSNPQHNNMLPNRSGNRIDSGQNERLLENFTGKDPSKWQNQRKQAVKSFQNTDQSMITDSETLSLDARKQQENRLPEEDELPQNNVLPFKQERVGPGLNQGYDSKPHDHGYHNINARDYAMPKDINELRAKNNPKIEYKGRTNHPSYPNQRGDIGKYEKIKPDACHELGQNRFTSAISQETYKQPQDEEHHVPDTNRNQTTHSTRTGAVISEQQAQTQNRDTTYDRPFGEERSNNRNGVVSSQSEYYVDDYGRSSIQVYGNERDTTKYVPTAPIKTAVKATIAPIDNVLRETKKAFTSGYSSRGSLDPQIPGKQQAYDPVTWQPKTTIKETTLHSSDYGKGFHSSRNTGPIVDPAYAPDTTIKETVEASQRTGTLEGFEQTYVRDPDNQARTTGRETLPSTEQEYIRNFNPHVEKPIIYDPLQTPKTTNKEMTNNSEWCGPVESETKIAQVNRDSYKAKRTHMETLVQNQRYGSIYQPDEAGYQITNENIHAPTTHKEQIGNYQYAGSARMDNDYPPDYTAVKSYEPSTNKDNLVSSNRPSVPEGNKTNVSAETTRTFCSPTDSDSQRYPKNTEQRTRSSPANITHENNQRIEPCQSRHPIQEEQLNTRGFDAESIAPNDNTYERPFGFKDDITK